VTLLRWAEPLVSRDLGEQRNEGTDTDTDTAAVACRAAGSLSGSHEAVAPEGHHATRERLERLRRTGVLTEVEFERLIEPTEPEGGLSGRLKRVDVRDRLQSAGQEQNREDQHDQSTSSVSEVHIVLRFREQQPLRYHVLP
jgi:hypothetical protein